jgi:hypothetical protein
MPGVRHRDEGGETVDARRVSGKQAMFDETEEME